MNLVLRIAAFLIGFGTGLVVLAGGNAVMPGFWLAAGYVALMLTLVLRHLEAPLRPAGLPLAVAGGSAFLALWAGSTPKTSLAVYFGLTQTLTIGLPILAGILLIASVVLSGRTDRRALLWLALALACASLVALASSDKGGADPMIRWFERIFDWSFTTAELATKIVRKTIHFSFYGTVGLFAWLAANRARLLRPPAFAIPFAFLLSAFDELRQSSFANRSGTPWDVLLDLAGAIAFVAIAHRIAQRRAARTLANRAST